MTLLETCADSIVCLYEEYEKQKARYDFELTRLADIKSELSDAITALKAHDDYATTASQAEKDAIDAVETEIS